MPALPMSFELVALKATLLLLGAMVVALGLRRASGNARHTLWTATTIALLALPVLHAQLPRLSVPWPASSELAELAGLSPGEVSIKVPVAVGGAAIADVDRLHSTAGTTTPDAPRRSVGFWLGLTWIIGILGFAMPVLMGVLRSRRLIAQAIDVDAPRLLQQFDRAAAVVGVNAGVALRVSPAVRTPMTGGVLRPVVLLPEAALHWSDDCLDAVLRHELVHVRQRDTLRQLASRLSVAIYWFHPLAWRAARLGALAREMACDEAVLRLGTRPSRYARHLLALADPMPAPTGMPALVRLDHPHLEERVMAILRASRPPISRRLSRSAALLIFAWTMVVAAAAPAVREAIAEEPAALAQPLDAAVLVPESGLGLTADAAVAIGAPSQAADCEFTRDSRTRTVSGNGAPVRMFSTEHEGTRLCATVRGGDADRDGFLPRGRLPSGVILTLATSNSDGERRLEIAGSSGGNVHRWFVDGRERDFDSEAEEWRDAMLDLVGVLTERSAVQRRQAVEAMGVARRDMAEARVAMGTARRHAVEVERRVAEREATVAGRMAEVHAREAMVEAHRNQELVEVRAPHPPTPPRAAMVPREARLPREAPRAAGVNQVREREMLREHQREMAEEEALMRERMAEVRAHARELEADHRRQLEQVQPAAPRAVPLIREQTDDPRTSAAADRLRAAIRASGE